MLKHKGGNGAMGFFFERYLQNSNKVLLGLLHCLRPYNKSSNIFQRLVNLEYYDKIITV